MHLRIPLEIGARAKGVAQKFQPDAAWRIAHGMITYDRNRENCPPEIKEHTLLNDL